MTAPHPSASIEALRRNIRTVFGADVVIGGIGDAAHAQTVSGHNPDDTPGVRAELSDADSDPEWRALDPMLGPSFSRDDADRLVDALVNRGESRRRLYYVIWSGLIWHRDNGWVPRPYDGDDPHSSHPHISGWAGNDSDGSDWSAVLALGGSMSLETDLNAYVKEYDGGDATSEPQRVVRQAWRLMVTGSTHPLGLAADVADVKAQVNALGGIVGGLAQAVADNTARLAELAAKLDELAAGQLADHTHVINTPTSGPVVDA